MYSPEVQSQIANLRAKAVAGTATIEDFRLAIRLMREGRASATAAAVTAGGKKSRTPVDVNKLFDDLEKL